MLSGPRALEKKGKDALLYRINCILSFKVVGPILIFVKKRHKKKFGKPTRINIGGGRFFNKRWGNMDFISSDYPIDDEIVDFNFDLTSGKPFPFESNSIDLFYSAHCIEHIPNEHLPHIFSEIHRCLKPTGGVRLSAPDLEIIYRRYITERKSEPKYSRAAQDWFFQSVATALVGKIPIDEFHQNVSSMSPKDLAEFYCSQLSREFQKENTGHHINWWNYDKLERMLKDAGFQDVRRSRVFESQFPEMRKKATFLGLEKFVRLDKICNLQNMLWFDSKAEEIKGVPDISVYAEAVK